MIPIWSIVWKFFLAYKLLESFVDFGDNYTKDKANEPELKIAVTWILNIINYYYSEQHTNRKYIKRLKHVKVV